MALQRGRKSAETLSSVANMPLGFKARPGAPAVFGANSPEAEMWRDIVGGESADWFNEGDLPLLEAYCRAAANYRKVSADADGQPFTLQGAQGGPISNPIYRVQDMLAKQMATLAVKLRLTQSSRVTNHQAASTAKKNAKAGDGRKPWQEAA